MKEYSELFEPDILTEEDYKRNYKRHLLEPEKALMLAILEDALRCYQDYYYSQEAKDKKQFQEAEEWIEDRDHDRLFSFEAICLELGLESDSIRKRLAKWKEKNKKADTT